MKKQQGDVILRKIQSLPDGCKEISRTNRGFVLAVGEATGHAHVITDDMEMYENNGTLYLKTKNEVQVQHEEHKPVTIEPGIWRIDIVKEYDAFLEETKRVKD